jgi:branched-chain amino acid transport system permease protein
MATVLIVFLQFSRDGKALRAMVQNRYAASLMGVNTERLNRIAFGAGVACAAVAGCILTPMFYTFPTAGVDLIITAFVVVVLGGLGSVAGAMVGGLIIGVTQTLTGFYISVELKDVIALVLFILILLIRPQGLFGRAGMEEVGTK